MRQFTYYYSFCISDSPDCLCEQSVCICATLAGLTTAVTSDKIYEELRAKGGTTPDVFDAVKEEKKEPKKVA
jgi:hypothetical protein